MDTIDDVMNRINEKKDNPIQIDISYSFEKPVSDIISSENQNEEICKWFTEKIDVINELKQTINIIWN